MTRPHPFLAQRRYRGFANVTPRHIPGKGNASGIGVVQVYFQEQIEGASTDASGQDVYDLTKRLSTDLRETRAYFSLSYMSPKTMIRACELQSGRGRRRRTQKLCDHALESYPDFRRSRQ